MTTPRKTPYTGVAPFSAPKWNGQAPAQQPFRLTASGGSNSPFFGMAQNPFGGQSGMAQNPYWGQGPIGQQSLLGAIGNKPIPQFGAQSPFADNFSGGKPVQQMSPQNMMQMLSQFSLLGQQPTSYFGPRPPVNPGGIYGGPNNVRPNVQQPILGNALSMLFGRR